MSCISEELANFLVSAAYDMAVEIRDDYSGRFMYGKTCLGLVFESNSAPFALFERTNSMDLVKELAAFLSSCRSDSMGRGIVLYSCGKQ